MSTRADTFDELSCRPIAFVRSPYAQRIDAPHHAPEKLDAAAIRNPPQSLAQRIALARPGKQPAPGILPH